MTGDAARHPDVPTEPPGTHEGARVGVIEVRVLREVQVEPGSEVGAE